MTAIRMLRAHCLAVAAASRLIAAPSAAQEIDHSKMHHPPAQQTQAASRPAAKKPALTKAEVKKPTVKKPAAKKPAATKPAQAHVTAKSAVDHSGMDQSGMDHSGMDHSGMDHSGMDHSGMDHSGMDHSDMAHPGVEHADTPTAPMQPITPIPLLTEADRIGALPPEHPPPAHDDEIHYYVLLNRFETWDADEGAAAKWEGQAWIGTDLKRLWLRSEGERSGGGLESGDLEVLYGRSLTPWWDVVAGVRHDFAPGTSQQFLALGVMGLAPYMFEMEATAYLGQSGRSALRVETEYDVLLTNRLILQPLLEVNFHGETDRSRGVGSGLGTAEAGLRLRYEIDRRFAPYIGVVRERAFGRTADLAARQASMPTTRASLPASGSGSEAGRMRS